MRVRLDPDACVGHGRCYALAPAHFEPDDLGHCIVMEVDLGADPPDETVARVRRAVDACPEGALTLED